MARKPAAPAAETSTELALFTALTPVTIVTSAEKAEELFTHIEQQIADFVPDLSTVIGRKAIASLAFKVTKTKTAITEAAEELIEAERKKVADTVAERKRIETKLDSLRDLARKPLTDWEEREEKRRKAFEAMKEEIACAQMISPNDTVAQVREVREELWAGEYDPNSFGEEGAATLQTLAKGAIEVLDATIARMEQQERDKAELEQLRAERAESDRLKAEAAEAERIAQEEAEAAERAAEQARQAEDEARLAAEQEEERKRLEAEDEQRRIEAAQQRAQEDERKRAAQALEDQRIAHEAELEAANLRAEEAERRQREEAQRQEAARIEQKRIEDEAAAELAARQADQAHRQQVKTDAKNAIMACGADEQTARNVVLAIIGGDVPNVTLTF